MDITYNVRNMFFDRLAVQARVDAQKRKRLSKAGAYVQRTARTSLRRKTTRPAPQPPATHSPEPNLRKIWFVFDPLSASVVVGPVAFNKRLRKSNRTTVPELMEHGGSAEVTEYAEEHTLQWMLGAEFFKRKHFRRVAVRRRMARYAARPFMGPALDRERGKFPELFRNCIGP